MSQRAPQEPRVSDASLDKPYNHRLDRHGRPFGSRVSSASLCPPGPRNKITPDINQPRRSQEKVKSPDVNQQDHSYTFPPDTRRMSNQYDERERGNRRETRRRSPNLQWRPKSPVLNQEATPPSAPFQVPNHQDNDSEEAPVNPTRKRGRPPKSKESKPSIRLSPKTFSGMGSKKRHLARLQASPGTSSRQSRTSRLSTRQNRTS
ncbi:hypothetical protein IGI04_002502, partial [Brassica rapa subsp. trilocularis]